MVVYTGSAADREVIEQHEWEYVCDAKKKGSSRVKFTVLLTSYETVRHESQLFKSVKWATVIIDEAHRLKSIKGATRLVIDKMRITWLLLLTGMQTLPFPHDTIAGSGHPKVTQVSSCPKSCLVTLYRT